MALGSTRQNDQTQGTAMAMGSTRQNDQQMRSHSKDYVTLNTKALDNNNIRTHVYGIQNHFQAFGKPFRPVFLRICPCFLSIAFSQLTLNSIFHSSPIYDSNLFSTAAALAFSAVETKGFIRRSGGQTVQRSFLRVVISI